MLTTPMSQATKLPGVPLQAARPLPATALVHRAFRSLNIVAPMTRMTKQVRPMVAAYSSEATASPEAAPPTSAAASRPSSLLVLKATAAAQPAAKTFSRYTPSC